MAGASWKDIAQEKGLAFQNKAIFGWLNGYYITLRLIFNVFRLHVYLPAPQDLTDQTGTEEQRLKADSIRADAARVLEDTLKEFKLARIRTINEGQSAGVEFRGNIKLTKRFGDFLEAATGKLAEHSIPTARVCCQCSKAMDHDEVPVLIREDVFPMHGHCADATTLTEAWDSKQKGSLLLGILGAALAAVVGAVPWAVVYCLGYMASIFGILIGFLVNKGYDLLHGRQGRVKIAVVLLFVLLSVAIGQLAGTSYQLSQLYDETKAELKVYEEMAYSKTDAIYLFWTEDLWADADTSHEILSNLGQGVFFALLGCFQMFRQLARDTAPKRPKRLDAFL